MRANVRFCHDATLHCVSSLLPSADLQLSTAPRDLLMLRREGTVYTAQRGLRSGIVYAGWRCEIELARKVA